MQRFSLYGVHKHDYQESVTTGQTDARTHRQTPDKVIPMCRYASQATQYFYLNFKWIFHFMFREVWTLGVSDIRIKMNWLSVRKSTTHIDIIVYDMGFPKDIGYKSMQDLNIRFNAYYVKKCMMYDTLWIYE